LLRAGDVDRYSCGHALCCSRQCSAANAGSVRHIDNRRRRLNSDLFALRCSRWSILCAGFCISTPTLATLLTRLIANSRVNSQIGIGLQVLRTDWAPSSYRPSFAAANEVVALASREWPLKSVTGSTCYSSVGAVNKP